VRGVVEWGLLSRVQSECKGKFEQSASGKSGENAQKGQGRFKEGVDTVAQWEHCGTMKAIEYESNTESAGVGKDVSGVKGVGVEGGKEPVVGGKGGVGVVAAVKPKGSSITLYGCGRRDGSDINNSMGLVEAYRLFVLRGSE